MLLKNQWVNEEIKEEIRKYFKTTENKNTTLQYLQDSSKQFWEVYSDTSLPQETRKISNKWPNLLPKGIRKKKAQSQQKEGKNKDQKGNK